MALLSVILHCDLDCFYAQVERERLGLPLDASIAVVQWSMALAVSYPARKFGIHRGSNVDDIRRLAGDAVTIVPVETIGGNAPVPSTRPAGDSVNLRLTDVQAREKVSLARYRKASANVFSAIADALCGYNAKLERASIDEAYIDVTAEVDRRVRCATEARQWPVGTVVVGDKLDLQSETDARLAYGADIATEVRKRVLDKCSYTVSAGISVNKLLSKFASAKNKPNQQTIVPLSAVPDLMKDVPLRKLRGLGGKLGKEVEAMGVSTAGEASALSVDELFRSLGRRKEAEFVYKCVRGIDETEVVEREATKSLLAAKNFRGEMSLDTVDKQWLPLLAAEVADRMIFDSEMNNRDAKTLTVGFRAKLAERKYGMVSASRSVSMPPATAEGRGTAIAAAALSVLRNVMYKEKQFTFPINFVSLTATNFSERANEKESISNYFAATSKTAVQEAKEQESGSGLDRDELYQRRRQERADRDLALRLHREESSHGIKKLRKDVNSGGTSHKRGKGNDRAGSGTLTVDMFFKSKTRNSKK